MRNKKGFTLVELVIVIAVIAILAGVMIGTFASVVKKAQKSAEQQEMAAARTEQVANDVLEKLNNQNWLGWEDFEEKLAKSLSNINITADGGMTEASVKAAVASALNEYAAAHPSTGTTNTGLTEQQVKYIIENALSGQLTAAQVKAIVSSAVSSTSTLTKSQVQAIVDAAVGKTLTASQVKEAVEAVIKANNVGTSTITIEDIEKTVNSVLDGKNYSKLTEKEVENIVKEALKDYSVEAKSVATKDDFNAAFEKNDKVTNVVIKLTEDMDLRGGTSIKVVNNTVIDLNGKEIKADFSDILNVQEGVAVTIKDGTIDSSMRALSNSGSLVLDDVKVKGGYKGTDGLSRPAIMNEYNGFMTINGGEYSTNDVYVISAFDEATTVINGGTFTGPSPVAMNGTDSKYISLIINDGTFVGTSTSDALLFVPAGTLSIHGGTFTGKTTAAFICGGNVNIYGGTFATTAKFAEKADANIVEDGETWGSYNAESITWGKSGSRTTNAVFFVAVNRNGYAQGLTAAKNYKLFISDAVKVSEISGTSKVAVVDASTAKTVAADKYADYGVVINVK